MWSASAPLSLLRTLASDSRLPSSAVFRKAILCVDVDFHISHVTCVFVMEGGATLSSGTTGELTIEQVFGVPLSSIHTHGQQVALSQQDKDGG